MKATTVRRVGQAVTALSAVIIAYATLTSGAAPAPDADDGLLHFMLFFPLGIGGAFWLAPLEPAQQRRGRALILLVILAFAAATEIGQMFIETRQASFPDFIADAAGAGLGVLLGGVPASRARREPVPEIR